MEIDLGLFSMMFLTGSLATDTVLKASYSYPLVLVSYLFAFAGSYVGLLCSGQVRIVKTKPEKIIWLIGGAMAMSAGIWSMHFIGMLAYMLPVDAYFDLEITALSFVPAIGASFFALLILSRKRVRFIHLALGSLLMGAGIGAMHYMGMEAIHADAGMGYVPSLFAVSVGVAVLFAYVALTVKVRLTLWQRNLDIRWVNLSSAGIMGIAISGMHYTAMSAVRFLPGKSHGHHGTAMDISFLLLAINGLVFLLIFLVFAAVVARKTYANTALVKAIEQQQSLEQELEKNLALFQTTVENFPGGLSLIDENLVLTLANQGYYDLLGMRKEDFPAGSALEDVFRFHAKRGEYGPVDSEKVVKDMVAEAKLFQPLKYERTSLADGKILQFSRAPLPKGGFVLTVTDVSDSRKAEEERVAMERELSQAQKMESLGTLASGVAHEINTPIQYIGDNIRFLQESFSDLVALLDSYRTTQKQNGTPKDNEQLKIKEDEIDLDFLLDELPQSMNQSLQGIGQVASIVNAIKEFSHPGQDEKTAVDLNNSIETTLTVSRNRWKYIAEVKTDLSDDLPLVNCYQGEINQVILNMVVNAAHAIEANIDTKTGQIGISTAYDGEYAEITISDNGSGMSEDVQKQIFDPFFTTKDIGKGTGQGLAISYAIVHQKHGGTIECTSEVGVGTQFTIRLPIDNKLSQDEQAA